MPEELLRASSATVWIDDESADQRRFLDKAQVRFARPHFLLGALPLAIVINQASDSDGASALVEIRPAECPQPSFPSVNAMNLKLHGRRFLGAAEKPERSEEHTSELQSLMR